jgi:hypothetical protein
MKKIFVIAILAAGVHAGWIFAAPPVKHYFLDAKIRDMAEQGRLYNQHEMLNEILRVVEEKQIPISAKDIQFRLDGNKMRISVSYRTTVSMPYYTKTYTFASSHVGVYEPKR